MAARKKPSVSELKHISQLKEVEQDKEQLENILAYELEIERLEREKQYEREMLQKELEERLKKRDGAGAGVKKSSAIIPSQPSPSPSPSPSKSGGGSETSSATKAVATVVAKNIFDFVNTIDERIYKDKPLKYCSPPINGITYNIMPPSKSRIFDYYVIGDVDDVKEVYNEYHKYNDFKVFYCDLCTLTKGDGIYSENLIRDGNRNITDSIIRPIENYAHEHKLRIETREKTKFKITPTYPQYYLNHCLLVSQKHVSTIQLLLISQYFKGIYECLHYENNNNFLKCIFNGLFGSNQYHGHGHLTTQHIDFEIDLDEVYRRCESSSNSVVEIVLNTSVLVCSKNVNKLYDSTLPYSKLYLDCKYSLETKPLVTFVLFKIKDLYCYFIQMFRDVKETEFYQQYNNTLFFLVPGRTIALKDTSFKESDRRVLEDISNKAKSIFFKGVDIMLEKNKNLQFTTLPLIYNELKRKEIQSSGIINNIGIYEYHELFLSLDFEHHFRDILKQAPSNFEFAKYILEKYSHIFYQNNPSNDTLSIIKIVLTFLLLYTSIDFFMLNLDQPLKNYILKYIELNRLLPLINQEIDTLYLLKVLKSILFNFKNDIQLLNTIPRLANTNKIGNISAFGKNYIFSINQNNMLFKFVQHQSPIHVDLINHEAKIGMEINILTRYTPNFVKTFGLIDCICNIDSNNNCFDLQIGSYLKCQSSQTYQTPTNTVVVQQYIQGARSMFDFVRSGDIPKIVSLCKQVFISILCAQHKLQFVHYDLHTSNIIVTESPHKIYKYYSPYDSRIAINNHGVHAYIIDYGTSQTRNIKYNFLDYLTSDNDIKLKNVYDNLGCNSSQFNKYHDFFTCIANVLETYILNIYPQHQHFYNCLCELLLPFNKYFQGNNKSNYLEELIVINKQYFLTNYGAIKQHINKIYKNTNNTFLYYLPKDFNNDERFEANTKYFLETITKYFPETIDAFSPEVCEWGHNHYYKNNCFKFVDQNEKQRLEAHTESLITNFKN